jgi:hypothetical protein
MKHEVVIQLVSESRMEEHFLHDEFPDAVWTSNPGFNVVFYLPVSEEERVTEAIKKWKENYETG